MPKKHFIAMTAILACSPHAQAAGADTATRIYESPRSGLFCYKRPSPHSLVAVTEVSIVGKTKVRCGLFFTYSYDVIQYRNNKQQLKLGYLPQSMPSVMQLTSKKPHSIPH